MLKRLIHNTVVSAIVFGLVAILGIVVIPIIIRTWGVTEFGIIVLTRLFLPAGLIGVVDFGLSEVTTQIVARAREHRDWRLAGSQILLLATLSVIVGVVISLGVSLAAPWIVTLVKVDASDVASFNKMLLATAACNVLFFPALVCEGVVKGFERYGLLRICEFLTVALYVMGVIYAAHAGHTYEVVAYCFLASGLLRALILLVASIAALRRTRFQLARPTPGVVRDIAVRSILVMQGKLIGGIVAPIQPFLIGLYMGPQSVGIYDTLVRIPRLAKVVTSLLTAALLPVVSRLDQRNNPSQFNEFGEIGVMLLPVVTVPACVATAVLSPVIMPIWIGPELTPFAHWMGIAFVVTICSQYVIFGNTLFMTRTKVQTRLNLLMTLHLAIWGAATLSAANFLLERAFIFGQSVALLAVLPWQLSTFIKELGSDKRQFWRAMAKHWAILLIGALLLDALMQGIKEPGIPSVAILLAGFCIAAWTAQYFFVLNSKQRGKVAHLVKSLTGGKMTLPRTL